MILDEIKIPDFLKEEELELHKGDWFDDNGLVKVYPSEDAAENQFLFTLELYLIKCQIGEHDEKLMAAMDNYMTEIINILGQYDNLLGPRRVEHPNYKYTSHDQLTAYCIYSVLFHKEHHKEIWKQLKRKLFTYNNQTRKIDFKFFVHPRDIIFIGYLNENIICIFLMPLLYVMGIISFYSYKTVRPEWWNRIHHRITKGTWPVKKEIEKTSGAMLYWLRHAVIRRGILRQAFYKVYELLLKRYFGNWNGLFQAYWRYDGHPIREHAKKYKIDLVG